MDAKEIKTRLKSARECIRNKEYKEALKHCKAVIAEDKNNYNAFVFIGVAAEGLDELDKAIKAYKRATDVSPEQVLAWQGLGGLYEKHPNPENDQELSMVYEKLLTLFGSDTKKLEDVKMKLAFVYLRLENVTLVLDTISSLLNSPDAISNPDLQRLMVNVADQCLVMSPVEMNKCRTCLETMLKQSDEIVSVLQNAAPNYIKILFKLDEDVTKVKSTCTQLSTQFPSLSEPKETLLIIQMDAFIGDRRPVVLPQFQEEMNALSQLQEENVILQIANGFKAMTERKFIVARDILLKASEIVPNLVCCHYFLSKTLYLLHSNAEALKRASVCQSLLQQKTRRLTVKSSVVEKSLNLLLSRIHFAIGTSQALNTSLQFLSKVNDSNLTSVLEGLILLETGSIEEAEEKLNEAEESEDALALRGWILYKKSQYVEAVKNLSETCHKNPNDTEYGVMYCRTLWELWKIKKDASIAQNCYSTLLKTAKQDPYHTKIFELLGYFYRDVQNDLTRARKCFEKSFDLDSNNDLSGAALCDLLTDGDNDEEAFSLLQRVTSTASAGSAKWAWLRFGLHQMKHDSLSSAVTSFQAAVRADINDSHVWECLAEAYLHRGSYTAALKAFTKVTELNPESMYSLFKIASIKQTLGTYRDAINDYSIILEKSSNFVPALKGIGETYLLIAKQQLIQFHDGRVKDSCQSALAYLTRAVSHRPDLCCLWKMMGDSVTLPNVLAKESFKMLVPEKLFHKSEENENQGRVREISLMQSLELGSRLYMKALQLLPECASLWHDLGLSFYHQACLSDEQNQQLLAEKCHNCLKKSVSLDAGNYRHWNALGVTVCSRDLPMYDPKLAQHCFIKSIQVEQNNVVAWTNLASLYLKSGNIQLAHEACKVAQSLDPSYVSCWIGQAIIAETVGDQDAMDLFRHTTELSTHTEGALGYAHWVCSLLSDRSKHNTDLFQYSVHHMRAIPAATDAMAHYLDRVKHDVTAYNLYGNLLEQQGLYRSAAEAWKSSLALTEENVSNKAWINKVKINLARGLCKLKQYERAIAVYRNCNIEDFVDVCYMALALYHSTDYQDACDELQKAVDMADEDTEKSQILAAVAMVNFKQGGSALDTVKTYLFQSSQLVPPSTHGLLALCALGILTKDASLTLAVMEELQKQNDELIKTDVAKLYLIYYATVEENPKLGLQYIEECIHNTPENESLWQLLSIAQIRHMTADFSTAANSALTIPEQTDLKSLSLTLVLSEIAEGVNSNNHDKKKLALKRTQKLCHLYPDKVEHWCILTAAIQFYCQQPTDDRLLWIGCLYLQWLSMECPREKSSLMEWINEHLGSVKQHLTG